MGSISSAYWDTDNSGTTSSAGGVGLTTAELQDTEESLSALCCFDFETVWAPGDAGAYPSLYAVDPVIYIEPDTLTTTYGQTDDAVATGSDFGGPGLYVFDDPNSFLDTGPAFANLTFADTDAGTTTLTLDETPLASDLGPDFRVVALQGDAEIEPADLVIAPIA